MNKTLTFIKKANKTNCPNDPFDIKKLNIDEVCVELAEIFTRIINHSFKAGEFPISEKLSCVRPLLKVGKDATILSSYRPVSNLSFLSKIIEYAALEQLQLHLSRFDCLPKFQSAYREFHSVETAICRVYKDLLINKSKNSCSLILLLDLSAAFDTVDHHLLLSDLEHSGILWICSEVVRILPDWQTF